MKKLLINIRKFFTSLGAFFTGKNILAHINGSIVPAEGAKKVWAINEDETVCVTPQSGKFSIPVKAGKWKLHIEAMNHYKYKVVDDIFVGEGRSADAGIIRLAKAS